MSFSDTPTLENEFVRLEPLDLSFERDLAEAVRVDELWRAWYTQIPSPETMSDTIAQRLALQAEARMAPWAIVEPQSGRAVGMTTFMNLDPTSRRLEIGSTWLGKAAQATKVNPAAKLLLLTRAFETLGCVAVEFRTHWHNRQSRAAIAKLGAKQDGVLRNVFIPENGTLRDTVVFSIIESEWSTVRLGLNERLTR